jgi:hypothetical protein
MNSVYAELEKLRKELGIFSLFGNTGVNDADMWITKVENHMVNNYNCPNDLLHYFHSFLNDNDLKIWFYKLTDDKKSDFSRFKPIFIAKCLDLEIIIHDLVDLKKNQFLAKLKILYPKLTNEIDSSPLTTYFTQKFLMYSKLFPQLNKELGTKKIIFQLEDKELIKKFYNFRKDNLKTIISFAELED